MTIKGKFCDDCQHYKAQNPHDGLCELTQSITFRQRIAHDNCFEAKKERNEKE